MDGVRVRECDIREVRLRAVVEEAALVLGELSLLVACPPCRGFSVLRTLNGSQKIQDHRSDMLHDVARFARTLDPMTVLAENVPGLAKNAVFDLFVDDLGALGYKLRHEVVDVWEYGVPQSRRRLLIAASRLGRPPVIERSQQRKTVRGGAGGPSGR